jgi:hypothetical protein
VTVLHGEADVSGLKGLDVIYAISDDSHFLRNSLGFKTSNDKVFITRISPRKYLQSIHDLIECCLVLRCENFLPIDCLFSQITHYMSKIYSLHRVLALAFKALNHFLSFKYTAFNCNLHSSVQVFTSYQPYIYPSQLCKLDRFVYISSHWVFKRDKCQKSMVNFKRLGVCFKSITLKPE